MKFEIKRNGNTYEIENHGNETIVRSNYAMPTATVHANVDLATAIDKHDAHVARNRREARVTLWG